MTRMKDHQINARKETLPFARARIIIGNLVGRATIHCTYWMDEPFEVSAYDLKDIKDAYYVLLSIGDPLIEGRGIAPIDTNDSTGIHVNEQRFFSFLAWLRNYAIVETNKFHEECKHPQVDNQAQEEREHPDDSTLLEGGVSLMKEDRLINDRFSDESKCYSGDTLGTIFIILDV